MTEKSKYNLSPLIQDPNLTLSERVYSCLRQAITTGALPAGLKLNEVHIAEFLEVSPTPVREAFRRLANDHLIVIKPWRGVSVKTFTSEEITALYQCQEVLMGLATRLYTEIATDDDLNELKSIYKDWLNAKDYSQAELNMQFHSHIAKHSGNQHIEEFLADYGEIIKRDMYVSGTNSIRMRSSKKELSDILKFISERNSRKAEEKMRRYIRKELSYKIARDEYKKAQTEKIGSSNH